jgi:hypothetical protein
MAMGLLAFAHRLFPYGDHLLAPRAVQASAQDLSTEWFDGGSRDWVREGGVGFEDIAGFANARKVRFRGELLGRRSGGPDRLWTD